MFNTTTEGRFQARINRMPDPADQTPNNGYRVEAFIDDGGRP